MAVKPTLKDNLIAAFLLTVLPAFMAMSVVDPYRSKDQGFAPIVILGSIAVSWKLGYHYMKHSKMIG